MTGEALKKARFASVNFERRKHLRFSINLPVTYWKIEGSKRRLAQTQDISEGGLLLNISEEIEVGQELNLKIDFTSVLGPKAVEARVQVVWKDFSFEKESSFRVGLKFAEISDEDLQELRVFLNNLIHL